MMPQLLAAARRRAAERVRRRSWYGARVAVKLQGQRRTVVAASRCAAAGTSLRQGEPPTPPPPPSSTVASVGTELCLHCVSNFGPGRAGPLKSSDLVPSFLFTPLIPTVPAYDSCNAKQDRAVIKCASNLNCAGRRIVCGPQSQLPPHRARTAGSLMMLVAPRLKPDFRSHRRWRPSDRR